MQNSFISPQATIFGMDEQEVESWYIYLVTGTTMNKNIIQKINEVI